MRRDLAPKGAAAIGGAACYPGSGPLGGVHQSPELRAPIRNTADGAVSAEAAVPGGVLQHADGWGHLAGSGRRAMRQEGLWRR